MSGTSRNWFRRRKTVAVVPMNGAILAGGRIGRSFDDTSLAPQIEQAFRARRLAAVALAINCPGGSAAQSSMIAARIRRLAAKHEVPVVAFCADVAASGGYWLACAADEIFADQTSIIGSIGVISAGFGFQDAIARIGVERRVHTAGDSKSMLDPFRPENPDDVARLKDLQETLHRRFIAWVRERRGTRLADDPRLFTGEIWVGDDARDRGLIDGLGHLVPVMQEKFGADIRFRVFGRRKSFWERFGGPGVDHVADSARVAQHYARFGLG